MIPRSQEVFGDTLTIEKRYKEDQEKTSDDQFIEKSVKI